MYTLEKRVRGIEIIIAITVITIIVGMIYMKGWHDGFEEGCNIYTEKV